MHARFLVLDHGAARFGFPVALVTEVLPLARVSRVPWSPRWLHGVMNHQGRLITLVDLGLFLGLPEPAPPNVVAVLDRPDLSLGLTAAGVAIVEARDVVQTGQVKQFIPQASWIVEALGTTDLSFQHLDLRRVIDGIEEAL